VDRLTNVSRPGDATRMPAVVDELRVIHHAFVGGHDDVRSAIVEDLRTVAVLSAVMRGDEQIRVPEVTLEYGVHQEVLPPLGRQVAAEDEPDGAAVDERYDAEVVLVRGRSHGVVKPSHVEADPPVNRDARKVPERVESLNRELDARRHSEGALLAAHPCCCHVPVHRERRHYVPCEHVGQVRDVVSVEVRDGQIGDRLTPRRDPSPWPPAGRVVVAAVDHQEMAGRRYDGGARAVLDIEDMDLHPADDSTHRRERI